MFIAKRERSMEHSSIVGDNVVERASSMAEKIASGDDHVLSRQETMVRLTYRT